MTATVIGALIAIAGTVAGIVIKAQLDRAAEHRTWLLDKAAGVYEDVLMAVAAWESHRDQTMRIYRTSVPDVEIPMPDPDARRRMQVRLLMFADPDVREAYDRYTHARAQWMGWHGRLRDAQDHNSQIRLAELPPTEPVVGDDLATLKTAREDTARQALNRADELTRLVHAVIQRSPRSRHWLPLRSSWRNPTTSEHDQP